MANKILTKFIKQAREKGFSDLEARQAMINKGWPTPEIEKAFNLLQPKFKFKNQICIFLNNELAQKLQKRANKNMFTISEQIEDILRRSCVTSSRKKLIDNVDDKFLSFFSRKKH